MVFITEDECAYCVLRTESLSVDQLMFIFFCARLHLKMCSVHLREAS
jgi:hypothetical protein